MNALFHDDDYYDDIPPLPCKRIEAACDAVKQIPEFVRAAFVYASDDATIDLVEAYMSDDHAAVMRALRDMVDEHATLEVLPACDLDDADDDDAKDAEKVLARYQAYQREEDSKQEVAA